MRAYPRRLNETFGKLTIREMLPGYKCRCDCVCGNSVVRQYWHVVSGRCTSCGCTKSAALSTALIRHGESGGDGRKPSPEYIAWVRLIARCTNPASERDRRVYSDVKVHPGWRVSYEAFLAYVGRKPSPLHSLDRWPDGKGNYGPGNVRWATRSQQNRNRRTARLLTLRGETKTLAEWAELLAINEGTIGTRLRNSWPIEKVLSKTDWRKHAV